ncbi:MAG: hypothetical protein ACRDAM_14310 [Casimicrobium sp.]
MLKELKSDLEKLKDWRIIILLLLSVPLLWYVLRDASKIVGGALAVIGVATALALIARKWLAPDVSRHFEKSLEHPIAAAISYAAALMFIALVVLAVAVLSSAR